MPSLRRRTFDRTVKFLIFEFKTIAKCDTFWPMIKFVPAQSGSIYKHMDNLTRKPTRHSFHSNYDYIISYLSVFEVM